MLSSWRWVPLPHHAAQVDELMVVLWSDYYGAALFGDHSEIARLPHKRRRLEVVATARSADRDVDHILPGQVIHHRKPFGLPGRFELPCGTTVELWDLVGFKLRLAPDETAPAPSEEAILDRARSRPQPLV